jgi:hypothetical protein
MPLLSRLFGRKQRDDEQTHTPEQPPVFRPIPIAQPAGGQAPHEASSTTDDDSPPAPATPGLAEEPDEDTREDTVEPAAALFIAETEPDPPLESTEDAYSGDFPTEGEPVGAPAEVESTLPQAAEAGEAGSGGDLDAAEQFDQFMPFAAPTIEPVAPDEFADAFTETTPGPVEPAGDPAAPSSPVVKLVAETPPAQPGLDETADPLAEPAEKPTHLPLTGWNHLDRARQATPHDNARSAPFAVPSTTAEPKTLIGGKEDDLVPLIPNTEADAADVTGSAEPDETGIAEAAVDSLKQACDGLVAQVKKLCVQQDGARIVAGMIALVGELDARYARDMGITRRNGVEELLRDVRGTMAEGDRFVLESLENGRGGLTAEAFLHDLKTIAPGDRPRLLGHYITFLAFMIKRVLHQYLRPLEENETRTYEISYHLDYLIEGVQDILIAKVTAPVS